MSPHYAYIRLEIKGKSGGNQGEIRDYQKTTKDTICGQEKKDMTKETKGEYNQYIVVFSKEMASILGGALLKENLCKIALYTNILITFAGSPVPMHG